MKSRDDTSDQKIIDVINQSIQAEFFTVPIIEILSVF